MPPLLRLSALCVSLGPLLMCQSKPEGAAVGVPPPVTPPTAARVARPATNSLVGTYRQSPDSAGTDCACQLAVTIWQTGRRLRYRIEDYPETGFVTADAANGRRGVGFVSTPGLHQEPHEWGGSLEGDTLLVQTYGNTMNEYENFVGGCSCKFLTLIKQP